MGKNSDFECDMLDGARESAQPGGTSRGEYALAKPEVTWRTARPMT